MEHANGTLMVFLCLWWPDDEKVDFTFYKQKCPSSYFVTDMESIIFYNFQFIVQYFANIAACPSEIFCR